MMRTALPLAISLCFAVTLTAGFREALAQTGGVPVCTAARDQRTDDGFTGGNPYSIVSDGGGGAIVAWDDARSGTDHQIYAQHILPSGQPLWLPNGSQISANSVNPVSPVLASDGLGGAIIAWADAFTGALVVQHVNGYGQPQWAASGVSLPGGHVYGTPAIIPDGIHGAFVAWVVQFGSVVLAQHLGQDGASLWNPGGVGVGPASGSLVSLNLAPDGAGGAIVAWGGNTSGVDQVYAQRVNFMGLAQWGSSGVVVASKAVRPALVSDGALGAIVTWADETIGSQVNVSAARLDGTGAQQWITPVCDLARLQQSGPVMAPDGSGGAYITWQDNRSASPNIYAQHVIGAGVPAWTMNGVAVCSAPNTQSSPAIAADGFGGCIITWVDYRSNPNADPWIFAQRMGGFGGPEWAPNGVVLCQTPDDRTNPGVATDGAGGAIVDWNDDRNLNWDIYAQHASGGGAILGVEPKIDDVAGGAVAWPNPFVDHVSIAFGLSRPTPVRMEVFDLAGRRVWGSTTKLLAAGRNSLAWDGRVEHGIQPAGGVYLLRVRGAGVDVSRAVVRTR